MKSLRLMSAVAAAAVFGAMVASVSPAWGWLLLAFGVSGLVFLTSSVLIYVDDDRVEDVFLEREVEDRSPANFVATMRVLAAESSSSTIIAYEVPFLGPYDRRMVWPEMRSPKWRELVLKVIEPLVYEAKFVPPLAELDEEWTFHCRMRGFSPLEAQRD